MAELLDLWRTKPPMAPVMPLVEAIVLLMRLGEKECVSVE